MNFEEQKVIEGLDEVQKLKKLFLFYSNNEKLISSQKFKKLIEDAGIIDSNFDYHYSDTIFHKKGNKIEFDSFCDILVNISNRVRDDFFGFGSKGLVRMIIFLKNRIQNSSVRLFEPGC